MEEINDKIEELVNLTRQVKELQQKIRSIKKEVLDFVDEKNINDYEWQVDNGFVEVHAKTKYKLADIPAEVKIPTDIAALDTAEKAFKSKIVLTKEGKQMFYEQNPSIVKLMIPSIKKELKVII